jgi:hypothetical protein
MSYGLEIYDENGNLFLGASSTVGRFIGSFSVPAHNGSGTKTTTFQIPSSALAKGKPFLWWKQVASPLVPFKSNADMNNLNMNFTVSSSGLVTVTSKVTNPVLTVYYGVF